MEDGSTAALAACKGNGDENHVQIHLKGGGEVFK